MGPRIPYYALSTLLAATAALSLLPSPAGAQPQSKAQAACISSMNKLAGKLGKAQGKHAVACFDLDPVAYQTCIMSTPTEKADKLEQKVLKVDAARCSAEAPDFGYTGPTGVIDGGLGRRLAANEALFGGSTDPNPCMRNVAKAVNALMDLDIKVVGVCKNNGVVQGLIVEINGIGFCLEGTVEESKVKNKLAAVNTAVADCTDYELLTGLGPECVDAPVIVDCVRRVARCTTCMTLVDADGLPDTCDELDDGIDNDSCPLM